MRESTILQLVRLAAAKLGLVTFRNSTGVGTAPDGSVIRYGLTRGGSDLIGWLPHLVTERDVGHYIAVFTAIECKSARGRTTEEQDTFLQQVRNQGGIAIVARSAEDVHRGVEQWTNMTT